MALMFRDGARISRTAGVYGQRKTTRLRGRWRLWWPGPPVAIGGRLGRIPPIRPERKSISAIWVLGDSAIVQSFSLTPPDPMQIIRRRLLSGLRTRVSTRHTKLRPACVQGANPQSQKKTAPTLWDQSQPRVGDPEV